MPRFSSFGGVDSPQVEDGDAAFLRMVSRLRPSQLQPGEVSLSKNGRMETNQEWQPREGWNAVSGGLTQAGVALFAKNSGDTGVIPLFADVTISSAARASNVVTVNTSTNHGRTTGETIRIEGLTGFSEDPNGNRVVASTPSATQLTYAHTGTDESFTTSSPVVTVVKLDTSTLVEVLGSCKFSDPSDASEEYILIATTSKVVAYQLSDGSTTDITYPGGGSISTRCDLQQFVDKVYMWRGEGATAWVWDGDLSGSPAFAAVGTGAATQQTVYDSSGNTAVSGGVATVSETSHGRAVGDELKIVSSAITGITAGDAIRIATVPTSDSFTFYADAADSGAAAVVYSTGGSALGGGFIKMPAVAWGVPHQRRLWLPYTHDAEASPASRNIRDEIIASDILDADTFDPISNQFRVSAGTADFLVAVHPFNDDNLIAFNRNSVHLLRGVSGSLEDVETVLITSEIGCVARKSVVTYAGKTLFLSDNGVYALEFMDEYNLRGTELPISEDIQDYIDRINPAKMDEAVAIYHNNRYWLFLALDSATSNSTCLVYNFINRGWESVDSTAASSFSVLNMHEARSGKRNDLYAVTNEGSIVQITNTSKIKDILVNGIGTEDTSEFAVPSDFLSRQFTAGTLERKKWNRLESHVRADDSAAADGAFAIVVEDPDSETALDTISDVFDGEQLPAGEGLTYRARCGNIRGYGAQVRFTPTIGRPRVRTAKLLATLTSRSTLSQK